MITEPMIDMGRKSIDSRHIESHINLIFTSNEEYPVHMERDDRRYCVIQTRDDHANGQETLTRWWT